MIAAIDPAGWVLVAMAGAGMIGAMVYLVATMPDEWDPDAMDRAEQPLGFRVRGPVVRPPFDWSDYPEFTDAAWWGDTYSVTEGGMVHDPDDLDMDPVGERLDAEQRWYALHDGWVADDGS